MYMIQVSSKKKDKISDYAERILRAAGKLMQCVETMEDDDDDEMEDNISYRHRDSMSMRDEEMPYDGRYYDDSISHRRGVKGTGPYSRYR